MYRRYGAGLQVLLVHPGGPFWAGKDLGAWSIPKGEYDDGEEPFAAARREFREELGAGVEGTLQDERLPRFPDQRFLELGTVVQPSRKEIVAWAVEGDFDVAELRSMTFEMEWPRGSGRMRRFPEVDRAAWLDLPEARGKILHGQLAFLDRLEARLRAAG